MRERDLRVKEREREREKVCVGEMGRVYCMCIDIVSECLFAERDKSNQKICREENVVVNNKSAHKCGTFDLLLGSSLECILNCDRPGLQPKCFYSFALFGFSNQVKSVFCEFFFCDLFVRN